MKQKIAAFVQMGKTPNLNKYSDAFQRGGYKTKKVTTLENALKITADNQNAVIIVYGNPIFVQPVEKLEKIDTLLIYWDADNTGIVPKRNVSRYIMGDVYPSIILKTIEAQRDYQKLRRSLTKNETVVQSKDNQGALR